VALPVENPPYEVQEVAFVELQESVEDCPWLIVVGEAENMTVGAHVAFDGVPAEQEPLHWMVPELVWPQAFGAEVQEEPYPAGLAGGVDEQELLHWIVPLACVWPQAFAEEEQAEPYPAGSALG
jgi:hypothetical protein